LTHTVVALR